MQFLCQSVSFQKSFKILQNGAVVSIAVFLTHPVHMLDQRWLVTYDVFRIMIALASQLASQLAKDHTFIVVFMMKIING